ncbi:MAG: 2-(1,2-epoxy-1,2-dihydrophenyl)acetyl-CoA isomerase [Chloroflexi bacterium]|nr:2-(1,2-epoxy-1,2-dihydrophenyl)acetyl-CoA isomerase [Chloroflexota bacterium]
MDSPLHVSREGAVMVLTLNRPKVNAFTHDLTVALQKALAQAAREKDVRAVLLNANGRAFSAGQDLTELQAVEGESLRHHLQVTYNPLILQLRRLEKPVLAALHGAVAGAALGVALACDLRIAAEGTQFLVGFSGIGLAPDSGVSLLLPLMMGLGRATEYAFTNKPFGAEEALAWGVVNRVVPAERLHEEALAWAQELAAGPLTALGLTKRAFNRAIMPHLEAVLDYEAHIQDIAGRTPEHHEGVQAFLEKRPPRYT